MRSAGSDPTPDEPHRGPHHARRLRSHRIARAIGMVLTAGFAFTATAAGAVYYDLKFNGAETLDLTGLVNEVPTGAEGANPDDPFAGKALNILVMGTDLRDAENAAIAGEADGGMRSDTTFVVHISGDRTRMEVVSIPRDSLVDIPACTLPDGSQSKAKRNAMFNSAFETGAAGSEDFAHAAACTINTVQALTNVPITNFLVVKMTGVVGVVNAIGGVTMCFDEPVKESKKYGKLDLPAGQVTLDGATAIDFLRARHGRGMGLEMGSDLTRITRQQAFIDSAVGELLSKNIITNSPELYSVVTAALNSLSADPMLSDPAKVAGLAFSLRAISSSDVAFTELPVVTAPSDPNRVVWTSDADAIWERIATDRPAPGQEPIPVDDTPATTPSAPAADPNAPAVDPNATAADPSAPAVDPNATAPSAPAGGPSAPAAEAHVPGVCSPGWVAPVG